MRKQLDNGRPYPAIRNATAMLIKSDQPAFRVLRAEAYNAIGEHGKAEVDAARSLELMPGNADGLYQMALAQDGLGRLDSAAALLRRLLDVAPSAEARYRLAVVEQSNGHTEVAMAEIDRILAEAGPDDAGTARLHRTKGELAALSGDTVLARAELDRAISLAPADPVNYNSRGYYLHAMAGSHAAAILDYNRAIKLNPNYSYAFNNRGWSRYRMGETAKGIKDIEQAKRRKAYNPYVYRNLGIIALEQGDTAKACMLLREALAKGFTAQHGPEVEDLIAASCGAAPVVQPSRTTAPAQPVDKKTPRSNAPE